MAAHDNPDSRVEPSCLLGGFKGGFLVRDDHDECPGPVNPRLPQHPRIGAVAGDDRDVCLLTADNRGGVELDDAKRLIARCQRIRRRAGAGATADDEATDVSGAAISVIVLPLR